MPVKQFAVLGLTTYIVVSLRFGFELVVLSANDTFCSLIGVDSAMEFRAQMPEITSPTAMQPNRVKTLCVKRVDTMPTTVATTGAYNFAVCVKFILATSKVIMF